MKSKFMVAFLGVLFFGLMAADVHAFCIYNKIDKTILAEQSSGGDGSFKVNIEPNGKACCNWQTKDCNTSGKRDGIVRFTIRRYTTTLDVLNPSLIVCSDFPIQADGLLLVESSNGNYRCVRYDYDYQ
jgi:hypothetical protein